MLRRVIPRLFQILAYPAAALAMAAIWSFVPDAEQSPVTRDEDPFPRVSWQEAAPRVAAGEWLLVDAREEDLFAAKHIPGAISLPAHSFPEMLTFFAEDHGTGKTTVVYCGTEDCDISLQLAARLRDEAGSTDVRILNGGFLEWQRRQ